MAKLLVVKDNNVLSTGTTAYSLDDNIVPEGYIKPNGTFVATENKTYDIHQYASLEVNVENVSGSGIEEVTELPVASAENVGKLYRYNGDLYECKEIVDLIINEGNEITTILNSLKMQINDLKIILVDSEPNVEDMVVSDMENTCYMYILKNGTNGWLNMFGEKLTFEELMEIQLSGVVDSYYLTKADGNCYLVHYYDNEIQNSEIFSSLINSLTITENIIIPKRVYSVNDYAFFNVLVKNIQFKGDIYSIGEQAFSSFVSLLQTIDLSNTRVVPILAENSLVLCTQLTEIKVPMALLEQFKSATNWSNYADLIVGV